MPPCLEANHLRDRLYSAFPQGFADEMVEPLLSLVEYRRVAQSFCARIMPPSADLRRAAVSSEKSDKPKRFLSVMSQIFARRKSTWLCRKIQEGLLGEPTRSKNSASDRSCSVQTISRDYHQHFAASSIEAFVRLEQQMWLRTADRILKATCAVPVLRNGAGWHPPPNCGAQDDPRN